MKQHEPRQLIEMDPGPESRKGQVGGSCNRTVCNLGPAEWWNKSTRKYYCRVCAEKINEHDQRAQRRLYGTSVCVFRPFKPDEVSEGD